MLVVDVETTGLYPDKHSIVSIGAVDYYNPENQFYGECKPWKGADINPIALEVNGFTEEYLKSDKLQSLEELTSQFYDWSRDVDLKTISGENVDFDIGFLKDAFVRTDLDWPFGHRKNDLHSAVTSYMRRNGYEIPLKDGISKQSLDKTLVFVGLPTEPKPHNGLNGAKLEAEAFCRLETGRTLLEEYSKHPLPNYLAV